MGKIHNQQILDRNTYTAEFVAGKYVEKMAEYRLEKKLRYYDVKDELHKYIWGSGDNPFEDIQQNIEYQDDKLKNTVNELIDEVLRSKPDKRMI